MTSSQEGDIVIERCRAAQWPAIVPLLRQLWPDRDVEAEPVRRTFEAALQSDCGQYWIARKGQAVVGFASLSLKHSLWAGGKLAQVNELVVDRHQRGQGIGTQLMRRLEETARDLGAAGIELDSAFHRESAHAFYERRGFVRRAYWFTKDLP